MKNAIEKILNSFVFENVNIIEKDISVYTTDDDNVFRYVVKLVIPGNTSMETAERLLERLNDAFAMLGFHSIYSNIVYLDERDKLQVRTQGDK